MARPVREDYPGAWHHVMNRGRNHDLIYQDDNDAVAFLFAIHKTIDRFGIEVHSYSLMPNHYHLLVRCPLGNLSDAMKHLGSAYTQDFNRRHGRDGSLFRGRFKSQLILSEVYLTYLVAYINLNPLRAGLVTRMDSLHAWTSYRRLAGSDHHPEWLSTKEMVRRFGSEENLKDLIMRLHRKADPWPSEMNMKTGWINWKTSGQHFEKIESREPCVSLTVLIDDICKITGVTANELQKPRLGPGGNPARRFAVWALHRTTYLKHGEIGQSLDMSKYQVAKTVERTRKNTKQFGEWANKWVEQYPQKVSIAEA